jgi:AsmA protein
VRNPVAVNGSGIWRGELVSASGKAAAPFEFLRGRATPVELRVESALMNVTLTGQADGYPSAKLTGPLQLSTPSLRRFASWLGSPIGPGSTLGQASGSGAASFDRNGLSVDNAEFTLDGNTATGALRVALSPKLDIAGTLAFDALDLTPYFAGLSTAVATSPDWRRVALPTEWFGGMNADIRLSANAVQLGTLAASSAAASAMLHDGRLEIGLARALFGGGSITGTVAVTGAQKTRAAIVEVQLRGSDIAFAVPAATLDLPLSASGTTSLFLDLSTKGPDLGAMLGELSGAARLSVTNARVPLFGIAEVARAAGGAVPKPAPDQALELVPVSSASAGLRFASSVATLDRGEVATPSYAATVQGWIGMLDGSLGLNGIVTPGGAPASSTPSTTPLPVAASPAPAPPDAAAPAAAPVTTPPVVASLPPAPGIPFTIEGTLAAPVVRTQ